MAHLRSIDFNIPANIEDRFPYSIPIIKNWELLEINSPVSIFVGENGSGKSTLLETLALSMEIITVGSENINQDKSLNHVRNLSNFSKLVWNKRVRKGFFLRAEDFFGYVKRLAQNKQEMELDIKKVDEDYKDRSEYAKSLAKLPFSNELNSMNRKYGGDLDNYSHGESFLTLFQARFVPGGIYLLDEPEAPLSPLRQLAFMSMIKEMVEKDAQFIIATHSPILLALPDAEIFNPDQSPIKSVAYEELDHVTLTRDFLNNPEQFLRHL